MRMMEVRSRMGNHDRVREYCMIDDSITKNLPLIERSIELLRRNVWNTRLIYLKGETSRSEDQEFRTEWFLTPDHDGRIDRLGLSHNVSLTELASNVASYDALNRKRATRIVSPQKKRIVLWRVFGERGVIGYQEFERLTQEQRDEFRETYNQSYQNMMELV